MYLARMSWTLIIALSMITTAYSAGSTTRSVTTSPTTTSRTTPRTTSRSTTRATTRTTIPRAVTSTTKSTPQAASSTRMSSTPRATTATPVSCGGSIEISTQGTLRSPGYPTGYPTNADCVWVLHTSINVNIQVTTSDSSIAVASGSCPSDYVKIYDGSSTSSILIGTFCGHAKPIVTSTGQYLTIRFHSGSTRYSLAKGFAMTYNAGNFYQCNQKNLIASSFSRYLMSPNYPFNYPNNADCSWRIDSGSFSNVVYISVILSSIEGSGILCLHDYVQAYDGLDSSYSSLGRWCGTSLPDKYSSGQYMFIKFHTDSSIRDTGFKISYQSSSKSHFYGFSIGGVAGGSVAGFVFVLVLVLVGCRYHRHHRSSCEPHTTVCVDSNAPYKRWH